MLRTQRSFRGPSRDGTKFSLITELVSHVTESIHLLRVYSLRLGLKIRILNVVSQNTNNRDDDTFVSFVITNQIEDSLHLLFWSTWLSNRPWNLEAKKVQLSPSLYPTLTTRKYRHQHGV